MAAPIKPIISKGGRDQGQGHLDAGGVVSRKAAGHLDAGGVVSKKQPAISAFVGRMVAEGRASKGRK